MTDILFGQSYYLRFDPKLYAQMQPYPPLGSLYAASYLRAKNYDVALFDAMLAQSEDEWTLALDRHKPRFAVLFEDNFNYLSKMCLLRMREAAFKMIALARMHGCIVMVNGSDATDHLAEYFARGADYVLIGEGELTLTELLDTLTGRTKQALHEIHGLAYRDDTGAIRNTVAREFIRELDRLPFPVWDLVDIPRYQRTWRARHGYYSMNMVTTRGCPYSCNWCAKPIYGQRYNVRSPENVVAELKWLKETFAPDHISFVDDIFGLKPNWIERFAELVRANDCALPFKCLMRADLVKDSVATALAKAKCQTVWMGAESGSQKILDAMDKGTRVEQIYSATKKLRAAGIRVGFFLQFGYRGETRPDIELTLKMVREALPDEIGISVSYPLPGTKFFERVQAELGEKQNWIDSNDLEMMYHGTYSTEFYRVLYRLVHADMGLWHARDTLRRVAFHPALWRAKHLHKLAVLPYWLTKRTQARFELNGLERRERQAEQIQATNPA